MIDPIRCSFALMAFAMLSTTALAENHVDQPLFGSVTYGNDECNNDPEYLTDNNIICAAVFSNTNVWDFLANLPRSITLAELVRLNPLLEIEDHSTVISGITFVRVR